MTNNIKPTDNQKSAIDCTDGHLQIIACAGSGKTEVISRRITNILQKKSDIMPENIVAFTFTEKAAESLKKRIETVFSNPISDMYVGTIHSFCKHILSKYTENFSNFRILDTVKNHHFINRYFEQCGMSDLELKPYYSNNCTFIQCIEKLIDNYSDHDNWNETQIRVLEKYINCLHEHKFIDFSLLIFEALRQIEANPLVQDYLSSIKYLVVDEYQDVNDLQEKLIRAIANYGANICVVGDDDQTIYQFRGSNAENMISFSERYKNATKIRLIDNFRSQHGIVDIASKVINNNKRRLEKQMVSKAKEAESEITARGYTSVDEEFDAIVAKINQLRMNNLAYKNIAILVRKGKYIPMIAIKLAAKGIPCIADSAEEFFSGKYFNCFIETIRNLKDLNRSELYEHWSGITSETTFDVGFEYLQYCMKGGNFRLSEILHNFCEKIDFLNASASDIQTRIENYDGFIKILDDYDEIYSDYLLSYRILGLLYFLDEQAREAYKHHNFGEHIADDSVQIMTVHKSKGLEFHTVFLPRLNKREFPVSNIGGRKYYHVLGGTFAENKDKYNSDIEDERKLFYVAVTRAKNNLYLSYTFEKQKVSEFVSEAAESEYLQIDRSDLLYEPPKSKRPAKTITEDSACITEEQRHAQEQEKAEREQYRLLVKQAREALYEDYHIANHFCPGIILEFYDICKQGDEAILAKALEKGLIKNT